MASGQAPLGPKASIRGHHRHSSSQRSTPRRITKGPLDLGDDPLSAPPTPPITKSLPKEPTTPRISSPALSSSQVTSPDSTRSMTSPPPRSSTSASAEIPLSHLAHLTRPGNFHPLPPPVTPLSLPPPSTPLSGLLAAGHFRAAALLAARQLSAPPSASLTPLHASDVLSLWHIRLAALSLLAFEHIASDEARALGDVVDGEVYRSPVDGESIIPWGLRVLAVRLQARAEGDLNRGVIGMHVLAREARRQALDGDVDDGTRQVWSERLADLRIRVVSMLVEVGDLEGAARLLEQGRTKGTDDTPHDEGQSLFASRLVLLYLHIGNVERATDVLTAAEARGDALVPLLKPLLAAADGKYDVHEASAGDDAALQNLAICKLYSGDLEGAKELLEGMVEGGAHFPTLLFNLTTMFELSTDNAKELKADLARSLGGKHKASLGVEFSGADLKL